MTRPARGRPGAARYRKYGADFRGVGNVPLACDADERQIHQKALLPAHLLGRLGVARGARVLDAGCGRGDLTMLLAQIGFDRVGCDVSRDAIENVCGRDCVAYVQSPLATLDLGESFAAVLCVDVLHHVVDDAEWQRSLAALHAHTRPGGHLCIDSTARGRMTGFAAADDRPDVGAREAPAVPGTWRGSALRGYFLPDNTFLRGRHARSHALDAR